MTKKEDFYKYYNSFANSQRRSLNTGLIKQIIFQFRKAKVTFKNSSIKLQIKPLELIMSLFYYLS